MIFSPPLFAFFISIAQLFAPTVLSDTFFYAIPFSLFISPRQEQRDCTWDRIQADNHFCWERLEDVASFHFLDCLYDLVLELHVVFLSYEFYYGHYYSETVLRVFDFEAYFSVILFS